MRQCVSNFKPNQNGSWEQYHSIISHGWWPSLADSQRVPDGISETLCPGMYYNPLSLSAHKGHQGYINNVTLLTTHILRGLMYLHSCCFSITYAKKGHKICKCLPTVPSLNAHTIYINKFCIKYMQYVYIEDKS